MSINKGDNVLCIKDKESRIGSSFINGNPTMCMSFEKGEYYTVKEVDDYIYVSDGGFLMTFYDGIEPSTQKHPNFWEYFKDKKQILNDKLKKIKRCPKELNSLDLVVLVP